MSKEILFILYLSKCLLSGNNVQNFILRGTMKSCTKLLGKTFLKIFGTMGFSIMSGPIVTAASNIFET